MKHRTIFAIFLATVALTIFSPTVVCGPLKLNRATILGMAGTQAVKAYNQAQRNTSVTRHVTPVGYFGRHQNPRFVFKQNQVQSNLLQYRPLSAFVAESLNQKRFREMTALYPRMYDSIAAGHFAGRTDVLLQWIDYALVTDNPLLLTVCTRNLGSYTAPEDLQRYINQYAWFKHILAPIAAHSIACDYQKRYPYDTDSVTVTAQDARNDSLMLDIISRHALPLAPAAKLTYRCQPDSTVTWMMAAADSVIAHPAIWPDSFNRMLLSDLLAHGAVSMPDQAIARAEKQPFAAYIDTDLYYPLQLFSCSLIAGDPDRANRYLEIANKIDPQTTQAHWQEVYNVYWDEMLNHPDDTALVDFVIDNAEEPVRQAYALAMELTDRYFAEDEETKWQWLEPDSLSSDQKVVNGTVVYALERGLSMDEGNTPQDIMLIAKYFLATAVVHEEDGLARSQAILDQVEAAIDNDPQYGDLRLMMALARAWQAGHGLDQPEVALKMMKKNLTLAKAPDLYPGALREWYSYMAKLADVLGKTKEAAKYRALMPDIPQNPDADSIPAGEISEDNIAKSDFDSIEAHADYWADFISDVYERDTDPGLKVDAKLVGYMLDLVDVAKATMFEKTDNDWRMTPAVTKATQRLHALKAIFHPDPYEQTSAVTNFWQINADLAEEALAGNPDTQKINAALCNTDLFAQSLIDRERYFHVLKIIRPLLPLAKDPRFDRQTGVLLFLHGYTALKQIGWDEEANKFNRQADDLIKQLYP